MIKNTFHFKSCLFGQFFFMLIFSNLQAQEIKQLDEIQIKTKQLDATQKGDTLTYNLNKLTNGTEKSLKDILNKMPGIITKDGKLYANGKIIDKILINGDELPVTQSIISEILAAKMIGSVQLVENSKRSNLFTGLNTIEQQVLNIKIKKEFLNVFKGELNISGGLINKYATRAITYNLGNKTKFTAIADANNIGQNPISINEFIELRGGITTLFGNKPLPISNSMEMINLDFLFTNKEANKINTQFASLSINNKITNASKCKGSVLFQNTNSNSWSNTSTYLLNNYNSFFQENNLQNTQATIQQGNFIYENRKSNTENFLYTLQQSYSTIQSNSNWTTTNFHWALFDEFKKNKNVSFNHEFSFLKRKNDKTLMYYAIHQSFLNKLQINQWEVKEQKAYAMSQTKENKNHNLHIEFQTLYKPQNTQYEFSFLSKISNNYYNYNLWNNYFLNNKIDKDTAIDFIYFNTNANFSVYRKFEKIHYLLSINPTLYSYNQKSQFAFPVFLKTNYYFSNKNFLEFIYKRNIEIINPEFCANNLQAVNYNILVSSKIDLFSFTTKDKFSLNYNYTKIFTGTNFNAEVGYLSTSNTFTTNSQYNVQTKYNMNQYVYLPMQKKYFANISLDQRTLFDILLRIEANVEKERGIIFNDNIENKINKDKYDATLSFQYNFKKSGNVILGTQLENNKQAINYKTEFFFGDRKGFLNFEYSPIQQLNFSCSNSYNVYFINKGNYKFYDLSFLVKYKLKKKPLEIIFEGNNILNIKNFKAFYSSYDTTLNVIQNTSSSKIAGYLQLKCNYFF